MIDLIRRQIDDLLDYLREKPVTGRPRDLKVEALEPRALPNAVGFLDFAGAAKGTIAPFGPAYTGGVSVATADLTGDGTPDTIAGTGSFGAPTQITVFDGLTKAKLATVAPFGPGSKTGVNIATGDFNFDGKPDVVVGTGSGSGTFAQVTVFDGPSLATGNLAAVAFVFPFPVSGTQVSLEARPSAGDFNGDGFDDLVVAAGPRPASGPVLIQGPRVRILDGKSLNSGSPVVLADVVAFGATQTGGAYAALGEITLDGTPELFIGAGDGNAPLVRIVNGAGLVAAFALSGGQPVDLTVAGAPVLFDFTSGDPAATTGVTVSAADITGDGLDDLLTGQGGVVRAYNGKNLAAKNATEAFATAPIPGRTNLLSVGAAAGLSPGIGQIVAGPILFRPTVGVINDQTVTGGKALTVPFTATDADQNPDTLTYTAVAQNPGLIPGSGLVFGGAGANRTLTITPTAGMFGSTVVTVTATDANGQTATRSFAVLVRPAGVFTALTPGNLLDAFADLPATTNPYQTADIGGAEIAFPGGSDVQARFFTFPTTQLNEINGGVVITEGNVYFAASAPGSASGKQDDLSVIFKYTPATDQLVPLAQFNRESGGLAVAADGTLLNTWFDGVYGTNPYNPDSATIGLSRIDPASGKETEVLFTEPVAIPGGRPNIARPTAVTEAGGKILLAVSNVGNQPGAFIGNPAGQDDTSVIRRYDPATKTAPTIATFNRETTALATAPDGSVVSQFYDGVYGGNPYGPDSAMIGISRIDPNTGSDSPLASEAVPGLPRSPFGGPPLPEPGGLAVLAGGKVAFALSRPTGSFFDQTTQTVQRVGNTTDIRLFDPATKTVTTLSSRARETGGLAAVPLLPVGGADTFTAAGPGQPITAPAPGVLSNDSAPNRPGTLRAIPDTAPPATAGTLVLNPDGSFTFTPVAGFSGAATFTYRVSDGLATSAPVTVTLNVPAPPPVNQAPVAAADTFTTIVGKALTVAAPGVLSNDSDPDNTAPLRAVIETPPAAVQGTLVLSPDGGFTFTPAGRFNGPATFTYRASDGLLSSPPTTVTINVTTDPTVTTAVIGGQVFLDTNKNGVRDAVGGTGPQFTPAPLGPVAVNRNDDDSSGLIDFGFTFNFFGKDYTQFFINNNGNITFTAPLSQFTPDGFPQSLPIVAPFWADVDTRGAKSAEVHLNRGVSPRGNPFAQIDWPGVGYFASHDDLLNDFSLYIEDDKAGDIVAFIYRGMQWTTGDASGGVGGFGGSGAQIGFDTGTGANFQNLGRPDSDAALAPFRNTQFVFRIDPSGTPVLFSEAGLDGRTIELVDPNGKVAATRVTKSVDLNGDGAIDPVSERGLYRFDNLAPAKYTVRLVQEAGFTQTLPANNGTYTLTVIAGDESLGNMFGVAKQAVGGPRERLIAVGAAAGGAPRVRVLNADGTDRFSIMALDGNLAFDGGVRVAVGDVNGDGTDDIVVGAGTGGGPRVEVYDGKTGFRLANFFAYEPTFRGGVHVAVGDVNGDGKADIVTGAGSTGTPRLRVFDGNLVPTFDGLANISVLDFFAFSDDLIGGVRVGAGDLDGDGIAEVVAAAGPSGTTLVRVFDGRTGAERAAFNAFGPVLSGGQYRGGLFVGVIGAAAGGKGSIVVSKDSVPDYEGSVFESIFPGIALDARISPPAVAVFDFAAGLSGTPAARATVSPFNDPAFLEGVRASGGVVVAGTSGGMGGLDEGGFIAGAGPGGKSLVQFFRYRAGTPELVREFNAFEASFLGGVYVGASTDVSAGGPAPTSPPVAATPQIGTQFGPGPGGTGSLGGGSQV